MIGKTISVILQDFYNNKYEIACLYICDSSDGKQLSGERKFNQWFDYFNDNSFIKYNQKLLDSENNIFPIAIIMKKDNPFALEIIAAFLAIINENSQDK